MAGVKRGKGKGEFERARVRGASEGERRFPSSLLPRAWSRALIPFRFPFNDLMTFKLLVQILYH